MIETGIVKMMVEREVSTVMPLLDLAEQMMPFCPALEAAIRDRFASIKSATQALSSRVESHGPFADQADVHGVVSAEVAEIVGQVDAMSASLKGR